MENNISKVLTKYVKIIIQQDSPSLSLMQTMNLNFNV